MSKRAAQKSFAASIIESPEYIKGLKTRAEAGSLAPAVEVRLLDLYLGKPQEEVRVIVSDDEDIEALSDQELLEQIRDLEMAVAQRIADRTPGTETVQ